MKGKNPYQEVCSKYFTATVNIKNHHTSILPNYAAVMHIGAVRQTVQVVAIKDKQILRIGDTAEVLFKL